jgi:oligopeptide transport system permease protein
MLTLLLRRLSTGLVTLAIIITLTFLLLRLMPGGPFDQERKLPPSIQKNIEARYHLHDPLWKQYVLYMGNIARGDLGPSYKYQSRTVTDIVAEASSVSFKLGLLALLVGVSLGIFLGSIAALVRNKAIDAALSFLGIAGISTPMFIFGGLLVLYFALQLNWFPAATLETPKHYVLPVITLALTPFAYAFLLTRSTVKEMKLKPFVSMKRSAGLPEKRIAVHHILRNSLQPLLAVLGPIAAAIITGSFAVEYLFAVPGLGRHFVTAVTNRDYPLVIGVTIVYGAALVFFNMGTDLLQGLLDPRLKDGASADE